MESPQIVDLVCSKVPWCRREIFESTLALAVEVAREGRRVGALFTLGGADTVMARSRSLILDPLSGHVPAATHITDRRLRGTIKELVQLDGAFVVLEMGPSLQRVDIWTLPPRVSMCHWGSGVGMWRRLPYRN